MTSRERVAAAFAHKNPDRVPMWCGASPEFWTKAKASLGLDDEQLRIRLHDDFRRIEPSDTLRQNRKGTWGTTVFGIEREGIGYGQPTSHPLAGATLDQIHAYAWPNPARMDASHLRANAESYKGQYAIMIGPWSPFFHDLVDMVGMENMYMMMYDQPEVLDAVVSHLVAFYFAVAERSFQAAAKQSDIFFFGNDFGSTMGPLMAPEQFERFFLPHMKRLIGLAHDFGLKTMMHCCGGVRELIPLMIGAGLEGLHAVQPSCRGMELAALKRDFGDKIVFNGAIDSQRVLIEGSVEFVRSQTRKVLDIMMPGGGYIAGASHDWVLEETPLENILAMYDTVLEFGRY